MTNMYRLHYAPDNASLIIRLALEEMGLDYETVLVDRRTHAQNSPEYRSLNPAGLIPVLETPQGPVFETAAILLWLADTHASMAPVQTPAPDAPARGAFLKWLFFVSNTLHADLRLTFYPALYVGPSKTHQKALRAATQHRLKNHLGLLDALASEGHRWFHPETPSLLGYYVACLMRWMALFPSDGDCSWFQITDTANLHHMVQMLEVRPATRTASTATGLGQTPFSAPRHATPAEGSPT